MTGNSKASKARRRRPGRQIAVAVLLAAAGVCALLYPFAAARQNDRTQSRVISDYQEQVSGEDETDLEKLLCQARAYNETLRFSTAVRLEPFSPEALEQALEGYDDILNVTESGMFGYVDIPAIGVHLPIYHGTSARVLEQGVGHLQGSSYPVGGSGTHAVLCAHSGLATSRLFRDLDQLELGDTFSVTVLNQVCRYQVTDIQVVLPEEVGTLCIQPEQDLVTLVTCTPYAINTHRLLVTGERIPDPEEETIESDSVRPVSAASAGRKGLAALCFAAAAVVLGAGLAGIFSRGRPKSSSSKTKS